MWAKTSSTINEKCDIFRALFSSFTNYNYLITSNWSFKCRLCFMWTRQTEQHGGGWRDGWKREHLELYPKFHTKYNRIQCKYILAVVFLPNFAVCDAEELKSKESGVKVKQKNVKKANGSVRLWVISSHFSPVTPLLLRILTFHTNISLSLSGIYEKPAFHSHRYFCHVIFGFALCGCLSDERIWSTNDISTLSHGTRRCRHSTYNQNATKIWFNCFFAG